MRMTATGFITDDRDAIREGLVTGLIGAAVVALFFLGVDLIRGLPLLTPSVLGETFVLRQPDAVTTTVNMTAVALYTAVHVGAFCGFGLVLVALVRGGERSSLTRYAILPVMLAFLIFFWGVLAIADEATRGLFPIGSVLVANILAALAMGWYLWRSHPALRAAFGRTPLGAPDMAQE
jgi:hypothetical protein